MENKTLKPVVVLFILFILVVCSLQIKVYANLSEGSFMVLVTIAAIMSILLPNLGQLKSFSITKGELILQEVKDSEATVKELALATSELVDVFQEYAVISGWNDEKYDNAMQKIRKLAART